MSSPPIKARTLDEVICGLPVEDQARVVAHASELVTEVLQAQDSRQTTHDEENPTVSQPLAPIDRIISGPNGSEIELRPIAVLLGNNNSGRSAFLRPLWRLHLNVIVNQNEEGRTYVREPEWGPVDTQLLSLRCDGAWTTVAIDVPALGPDRVRVVEDVDPGPPPESYPAIRLPDPLHASVKEVGGVGGHHNQELMWRLTSSEGELGERLRAAVSDDVRALGLGQGVEFRPAPEWKVKEKLPFVVSSTGESFPLHLTGSGMQDVLHVLIALRLASPGQIVPLENPEAGLHPRAVIALTGLLVEAARRGVRLIVETHSTTILRALQLAVAEDDSGWVRDNLVLYWFELDGQGVSRITQAEVQADGSYGDWPCDLTTTELDLTRRLLDASYRRRAAQQQLPDET